MICLFGLAVSGSVSERVCFMDELGYDVELTYKRKTEEKIAR